VSDEKLNTAPEMPTDRPPTRAEVWAYITHVYEGLWTEDKMEAHAKACWAGNYVRWVNLHGWRKKPDWEGEAQLELGTEEVEGPISVDNANYDYVKGLMA
jgi:hypothetical protein